MTSPTLPNFLVIGAEKSGTTWLKHNLRAHPEIFVPAQKEVHFFDKDKNFRRGLDWYGEYFLPREGTKAIGELTPGYLASSKAPARIARLLDHPVLVAILRNPVDRAYSAYWMGVAKARIAEGFELALKRHRHLIDNGRYGRHLRRYLEHFDAGSLLLLRYEDLAEPEALLARLYSFLGVSSSLLPEVSRERIFRSSVPRSVFLNRFALVSNRGLRAIGLDVLVRPAWRDRVRKLLQAKNVRQAEYPPMPAEVRCQLSAFFKDDLVALQELTGFQVGGWLAR